MAVSSGKTNKTKKRARRAIPRADVIARTVSVNAPDDRLAQLVREAQRGFQRSLQLRIAQHDVPIGHWRFLCVLWDNDGLTQRELAERVGLMEPTAFTALKAMERLGYVTRSRHPESRRQVHIYLTPRGRELRRVLVPLAEDVNTKAVRGVPSADVDATRRTLSRIIENLLKDEARCLEQNHRIPSNRETSLMIANSKARKAKSAPKKRASRSTVPAEA